MSVAAVGLTVVANVLAAAGWRLRAATRGHLSATALMTAGLALVAVLLLVTGSPAGWAPWVARTLLVLLGLLAVTGGGPLAVAVLVLADHRSGAEPIDDDEILRGGAWIGSLERAGIFGTLAAGWPEGVAVVLAIKGVGRYQELGGVAGAAERFIIGTFASALWAAGCAAVWWFGAVPAADGP